jgi:hypothetical protein
MNERRTGKAKIIVERTGRLARHERCKDPLGIGNVTRKIEAFLGRITIIAIHYPRNVAQKPRLGKWDRIVTLRKLFE